MTHIKSMNRKYVRLKREYFSEETHTEDLYNDDGDILIEEDAITVTTYPLNHHPKIIGTPLRYFKNNWLEDVFEVYAEFYGVDMSKFEDKSFEVGSVEPIHRIALRGLNFSYADRPTFYDASLFEVVKEHTTWVADDKFNNQ